MRLCHAAQNPTLDTLRSLNVRNKSVGSPQPPAVVSALLGRARAAAARSAAPTHAGPQTLSCSAWADSSVPLGSEGIFCNEKEFWEALFFLSFVFLSASQFCWIQTPCPLPLSWPLRSGRSAFLGIVSSQAENGDDPSQCLPLPVPTCSISLGAQGFCVAAAPCPQSCNHAAWLFHMEGSDVCRALSRCNFIYSFNPGNFS